jgi:predicted TIM-barrel fold metal-dependent hydrolase
MMIVDFHTHVLPPRVKEDRRAYVARDPTFAQIYSSEKVRIATAADLIASMEREGIAFSVVVNYGWSTHELCVETNDYILESVARYPERLAGFCAVSCYDDDASLAEVERCARAGVRGVGELRPDVQMPPTASPASLAPLSRLLREHNLILLTHSSEPVGHLYPGKGAATPARLYDFISAFTGVPVVCAHWGGGLPFYTLMPEVRRALEDVYFDTAVSPFLYRPEVYRLVRDLVGADRILFGSDYPVVSPSRLLQEIESLGLPDEDKALMLSGNARRLLGV